MEIKPTYEELLGAIEELRRKEIAYKQRIAYLTRMLYGSKKDSLDEKTLKDLKSSNIIDGQPGLFDDYFKEAMAEKAEEIEKTAKEIDKATENRRKSARKTKKRPSIYQYYGLEERERFIIPEGVDLSNCVEIGRDITRLIRYEKPRLWVDVIIRPIYREKSDKNLPDPRIYQGEAQKAVIGGNHVGADFLAKIVVDKFCYHIPEYRQVKQYADMGVKLPMSTLNDWIHAVSAQCTPSDPMGKALEYAYRLWPRLRRYTDNGIYQIDNNAVERNQRPTVLGRKNYLFSKNDKGAVDNAIFYTLLESCDIVGINPQDWLTDVLANLHDDTPPDQIKQMLPFYYKKSHE